MSHAAEQFETDTDIEQAQATVALVTRLKSDNATLTAENNHLREQWAAQGAELRANAQEIDVLRQENISIRTELNNRVKVAQEALSGLLELGNTYRPPALRSHIAQDQPLPRAVQRGPARPDELMDRPRMRVLERVGRAITGTDG
jgi:hypothetical protein